MKSTLEDAAVAQFAEPRRIEQPGGESTRIRRRGRPLDMPPEAVLERVRQLAARDGGLFRVHLTDAPLYARARRLFGSWQGAVRSAGFDYVDVLEGSRRRAVQARRSKRATRAVPHGAR